MRALLKLVGVGDTEPKAGPELDALASRVSALESSLAIDAAALEAATEKRDQLVRERESTRAARAKKQLEVDHANDPRDSDLQKLAALEQAGKRAARLLTQAERDLEAASRQVEANRQRLAAARKDLALAVERLPLRRVVDGLQGDSEPHLKKLASAIASAREALASLEAINSAAESAAKRLSREFSRRA